MLRRADLRRVARGLRFQLTASYALFFAVMLIAFTGFFGERLRKTLNEQTWEDLEPYRGITPEALIAGSIDEVAAEFRVLEELGYTDVIVRHLTNDQPKVLGSLQRLGKVRTALG